MTPLSVTTRRSASTSGGGRSSNAIAGRSACGTMRRTSTDATSTTAQRAHDRGAVVAEPVVHAVSWDP